MSKLLNAALFSAGIVFSGGSASAFSCAHPELIVAADDVIDLATTELPSPIDFAYHNILEFRGLKIRDGIAGPFGLSPAARIESRRLYGSSTSL